MARYYYKKDINQFLIDNNERILGELVKYHEFALEERQRDSWRTQIILLKNWLTDIKGTIILEYSIPRMGRRIDCVILSDDTIFAIEFKVGEKTYNSYDIDQVVDYALDLKNFHEQSQNRAIIPILICTEADERRINLEFYEDYISKPILTNGTSLRKIIHIACKDACHTDINSDEWVNSRYMPTPTIIEAAQALYNNHSVEAISRSDAKATNLNRTANAISQIIKFSKKNSKKSICFLTGVPGAGKTLAGLNLANSWHDTDNQEHAVFLSGNGPLVSVLREALARDEVKKGKENGKTLKKVHSTSKVKSFIQNIHHFRDNGLESTMPPIEKVVIFDEAQRAWTLEQTASFMKNKKNNPNFNQSEPEFLISYMDRHSDWATIVCLVGGGQEINTGEAGLHEWFNALKKSFPYWDIYVSSNLQDHEYTRGNPLYDNKDMNRVHLNDDLHLAVSLRSFRSEKVAALVKAVLDQSVNNARTLYNEVIKTYPIYVTRNISQAKDWLRIKTRGSERSGIIASSGAIRLKPFGINVKASIDPIYWFLNDKNDVRSSNFLEDVATEFDIQGLELDWTCVAWDADLRYQEEKWELKSFRGTSWQSVNKTEDRIYLINAYRVLLTRARRGMIIFVPNGDINDKTRYPEFYDGTYKYLRSLGFKELSN